MSSFIGVLERLRTFASEVWRREWPPPIINSVIFSITCKSITPVPTNYPQTVVEFWRPTTNNRDHSSAGPLQAISCLFWAISRNSRQRVAAPLDTPDSLTAFPRLHLCAGEDPRDRHTHEPLRHREVLRDRIRRSTGQ